MLYDIDEQGLYVPSTDDQATNETKALLTALSDVANMPAVLFGHEVSLFGSKRKLDVIIIACLRIRKRISRDNTFGMSMAISSRQT